VTGHRITRLTANRARAFAQRFGDPDAATTEDGATVLFETDRGASGSVVVSQVSPGRKNRLWFSFDGPDGGYVFDQELPDSLWIGGRTENRVLARDPDALSPQAGRYARLPAGHPQGYQDCFNAFVADVHASVRGEQPDGLPVFRDGLRAAELTAAVVESDTNKTWVEVPA
jgi:predicted dehydrogenase